MSGTTGILTLTIVAAKYTMSTEFSDIKEKNHLASINYKEQKFKTKLSIS